MPTNSLATETPTLKVGEVAPDFTLPVAPGTWTSGKFTLSDMRGKKNVVLAFYPLAWTPN